jgi:signal transduction histidine kinase
MSPRTVRIVAWGSLGVTVALCVGALMISARNDPSVPIPQTAAIPSNVASMILIGIGVLTFSIVGALIATRRPDNAIGWLFCADGMLIAFAIFDDSYEIHGLLTNPGSLPGAAWFGLIADALWLPFFAATSAFLFLLFPEGRPVGRPRRIAVRIGLVAVVLGFVGGLLETNLYAFPSVANPLGVQVPAVVQAAFALPAFLGILGVLVFGAVNLVVRLRRATGDERLQLRWFSYAVAVVAVLFVPTIVLDTVPTWVQVLGAFALFTMPIAVAFAILKYRLYEIDVVIKKTLVYAILAGLIVAVGAVVILIVGGLAVGPASDNEVLLIAAGVVMGFAIWPLQRLATRIADRIVFKGRETPYAVLTSFAGRVAETYSTDDVLPRMAQVLAAGTGADVATVWLRSDDRYRVAAVWPPGADEPDAIPIDAVEVRHQGETLGALSVEMPANDPMNPSKEALIHDLASQAGLVLRNVRLIEDLRGSRRRIVAAQDEQARKLERNIHDGAQQQLVALQVKLRLADSVFDRDPSQARALLDQLQRDSNDALENLRDLARGIYPPLLADKGLPTALEAQARKAPVPVEVKEDGTGRYTPEIESAVYFSCLEALQNAAKYAQANHVIVRLTQTNGSLSFEVRDDGRGFDLSSTNYGTGLQGIADRLAALGGELSVESRPGSGAIVSGRVPVEQVR